MLNSNSVTYNQQWKRPGGIVLRMTWKV